VFAAVLSVKAGDSVTVHALLLRGVNVAGNKLAMSDLRAVVEALGGRDVRTYLQSGNVVYAGPASVAKRLAGRLAEELDVKTAVLSRTHAELVTVVRRRPYPEDAPKVSVTFLDRAPAMAKTQAIDATTYRPDEFVVEGREVYVHTPGGYGRSKLTNAFFESKLGVVATTRNWNTVLALTEMTS
jgi:uncharacterized protein (DUF1697 family)